MAEHLDPLGISESPDSRILSFIDLRDDRLSHNRSGAMGVLA
jgi:hypothetical protein